jgi:hypothetical protein
MPRQHAMHRDHRQTDAVTLRQNRQLPRAQSGLCRRSATIRSSSSGRVWLGLTRGRRLRSSTPATPCSRNRRNHRYPVGRVISYSRHNTLNDSPRLARTTNSTR